MSFYIEEYTRWINSPHIEEWEREQLLSLVENETEIESRFYMPLKFGTAGLRGIMAPGLNRMNIYVVRQATQGIANLVLQNNGQQRGVAVAHDCRINSRKFAEAAACVLAANGIKVYLFDELRPTPELSFAIRKYGCIAGINVTASHNPKEYNGYKAYWEDGAQLPPAEATVVEKEIGRTDIFTGAKRMEYDEAVASGMIKILGSETDEAFLDCVLGEAVDSGSIKNVAESFKVVYTPFHGAGYKLIPEALKRSGLKHLIAVDEQMVVDGAFPTVANPNPEFIEGYEYAGRLAEKESAQLVLASDPDADRIGVMYRERDGGYTLLNGNQTGTLLLEYIASARKRLGTMPANPYAIRTIVSSDLIDRICENYGMGVEETFTGFKFIAERLGELEPQGKNCIFSYEESFGYMVGGFCRDKDAVTAAMLMTEMAAYHFANGKTLGEALEDMFSRYGAHRDLTMNVMMPGLDGSRKMEKLMEDLRSGGAGAPEGMTVGRTTDFLSGDITENGAVAGKSRIDGSNVLSFEYAEGGKLMVRPSGTEPKIKFYLFTRGENESEAMKKLAVLEAYVKGLEKRYA